MSQQPPNATGGQYPAQGYGAQPPASRSEQGPAVGMRGPPGMRPVAVRNDMVSEAHGVPRGAPGSVGRGRSSGGGPGIAPRPLGSGNIQSHGSSGLGAPQGLGSQPRVSSQGPGSVAPHGPPSGVPGGFQSQPLGPMSHGSAQIRAPIRPPSQQQQQQGRGPQQGYGAHPGAPQQRPMQAFSQQPQGPPPGGPLGQGQNQGPQQMASRTLMPMAMPMQGMPVGPRPRGPLPMPVGPQPGIKHLPKAQYSRPPSFGVGPSRAPGGSGSSPYGNSGSQYNGDPGGATGQPYGGAPPQQAPQQQGIPSQLSMPAFGAPSSFGSAGAPPAFGGQRVPPPGSTAFTGGVSRSTPSAGFGSGAYDTQTAGLAAQFEQLALGKGQSPEAGQPAEDGPNLAEFPRPIGAESAAGEACIPLDQHSCDPGYLRPTTSCVPSTAALRSRWHLPLGVIVNPLNSAARPVPVSDTDPLLIVRCEQCRTYMNPFMTWTDGGRRYSCNVCNKSNEVPSDYFTPVDPSTGRRTDEHLRPELSLGSVEYVAPEAYMVRAPMPPTYLFLIDVSAAAVSSGVLPLLCSTIKDALDSLPGDERTLFGLMTYDAHVHFYNLKAGSVSPKMVVMSDVEDPFVPLPDDLLVNLADSRSVVDALLDALPATFAANNTMDSALGPALQTAYLVMAGIGGKLLVFQSTVPSVGIAKIKNRDAPAAYNTDREPLTRKPEDPFFKKYAAEASRVHITVDMFCMAHQYTDLASLGTLSHYTAGQVYFYPGFHADRNGAKLRAELTHNLTRETGWEAVMRVRCSRGLNVTSFHGPFFVRSSDLLALPQVDTDKTFAVQFGLEDNIVDNRVTYVQCALLYTNGDGQRRIRVHTMALPVTSDLPALYAGADQGAITALLAKLSVERMLHRKLEEVRSDMQHRLMRTLKDFRQLHTPGYRAHHRIIWPSALRMMPLYILGLTKCAAFRGGHRDVAVDDRMAVALNIQAQSVDDILRLVYPTMLTLHDPTRGVTDSWGGVNEAGQFMLPPALSLEIQQLSSSGAYLLDNGRLLLLWLGRNVTIDYVADLFGVPVNEVPNDVERLSLEPAKHTKESKRFNGLLEKLREGRTVYQEVHVIRQGDALEQRMAAYLVEDGSASGPAYLAFLLQLHKAILASK